MADFIKVREAIYKSRVCNALDGNNEIEAAEVEFSNIEELKDLADFSPELVEAIKNSDGTLDPGAMLTRNVILGKTNEIPAGATIRALLAAAVNVKIEDGMQWILPASGNHIINIDTLTLGKNSSIRFNNSSVNLTVNKLIRASVSKSSVPCGEIKSSKNPYDIGIFGLDGEAKTTAAAGEDGAAGKAGAKAKCGPGGGTPIGGDPASNGHNGSDGKPGKHGEHGNNGMPSLTAEIVFNNIDPSVGVITLNTCSGAGGKGGDGGRGGNGGNGGTGGDGSQCGCTGMDAANGGNGGNGAKGGNGGNGGNAVNGEVIVVKVPESFGKASVKVNSSVADPGKPGNGGAAGSAGAAGVHGTAGSKYSDAGKDGTPGNAGEPGEPGKEGTKSGTPGSVSVITIK